ncbi:MAG: TylF/MycF/NovP-related O-methyltransferase [Polyangiaceae bacterium]
MKALTLARLLYRRFAHNDLEAGFSLLHKLGSAILPGYRFQFPQIGWWLDPAFNDYLRRFGELDGMNGDRKWMLFQLCRMSHSIPGDTAECGVFRGASSYLICLANDGTGKRHHLFDSFEGLSAPGSRDGRYWTAGALACSLHDVQERLERFADVNDYHEGWIPDRFPRVADRRFSFVHVDVDLEQPTGDSALFFYERLNPGGIFLCDDYGFSSCPGATVALDEFLSNKPEKMVALSGGGGFFIKGVHVGPSFESSAGVEWPTDP